MRQFRLTVLVVAAVCCQLEAHLVPQRLERSVQWDKDAGGGGYDVEPGLERLQRHVRAARSVLSAPHYFIQEKDRPDANHTCLTERCVRRGERMLDALDLDINPCNNFAKYACGKRFLRDMTSGADDSLDEYERKENSINSFLKETLDGEEQGTWTMAEMMAQKYYQTCKKSWFNTTTGTELYESLAKALGADHLEVETDIKTAPKTLGAMLRILNEEYGVQFAPRVQRMPTVNRGCSILVDDGGDYYNSHLDLASYEDVTEVQYELQTGLDLVDSYKSMVRKACENKPNIRNTTLQELVEKAPKFDWPQFLNVNENLTTIYIQECVLDLTKDLLQFQTEYPMGLKTMLVARALRRLWKKAGDEDDCLKFTTKYFNPALTSMYISDPRHKDNLAGTSEMMGALSEALRKRLELNSRIDTNTKKFYNNKLKQMRYYIGYDKTIVDQKEDLEAHYFTVNVNGFLPGDLIRLARWHYAALERKCDISVWDKCSPLSVYGQYESFGSALVAPLGLVSGTKYDPQQPSILNYAALGVDLGLLLMNTLDKDDRNTDAWGKKYNINNKTLKKLSLAEECLHRHYQRATGEADYPYYSSYTTELYGLKLASAAWRAQGGLTEQQLPGISELYTPQQVFYLVYAQTNCYTIDGEEERQQLSITLGQILEVGQLWNCSSSSDFNPAGKKCHVW